MNKNLRKGLEITAGLTWHLLYTSFSLAMLATTAIGNVDFRKIEDPIIKDDVATSEYTVRKYNLFDVAFNRDEIDKNCRSSSLTFFRNQVMTETGDPKSIYQQFNLSSTADYIDLK